MASTHHLFFLFTVVAKGLSKSVSHLLFPLVKASRSAPGYGLIRKAVLRKYLICVFAICGLCIAAEAQKPEIKWDKWGVPHVSGKSEADVYYAYGWAQMRAHGNTILRLYGQSRGRASEYWGGTQNLEKDRIARKLEIPTRAASWFDVQDKEMKRDLISFVAGMNDFCRKNPDHIRPENKIVLPIQEADPLSQLQVSYHLAVGGFAMQPQAAQWRSAGSNAWAIAPRRSASGKAMLMMQPHPPWADEYLFFEAHLTGPRLNIYGIGLLGVPAIAMGFNEDLGWGMTFNQADAMDLIEIETRGDEYLIGRQWRKLAIREETISVKGSVGETIRVKTSEYGPIVEEKGNKALAMRLSGFDRPHLLKQLSDMAHSRDLKSFQTAVSKLQLPLQNIIYADRAGNILYLYNGIIPRRPGGAWSDWAGIISASKPGVFVTDHLTYAELPKLINPSPGFIANSNNDPWTSTYPFELNPKNYPNYVTDTPFKNFDLRSQRSIKLLMKSEKLSFEQLVELQSSTHSELADRIIGELIEFGERSENDLARQAATVLQNWDRSLEARSSGAVLFANWYFAARRGKIFEKAFSVDDPLNTPNTLTNEAKAKLLDAALQTTKSYGPLDVAWGDVYRTSYAGKAVAGGLGLGEIGSFNAGFYTRASDSKWNLAGGSAYTSVVEFGKRVRAKGILSYGNATENSSPFRGDQLQMMVDRQLREVYFYKKDIERNLSYSETLLR